VLALVHVSRLPEAPADGKPYSADQRKTWVSRVTAVAKLLYHPPADPCAGLPAEVCAAAKVAAATVTALYDEVSPPKDPKEAAEPAVTVALQVDLLLRALRADLAPDAQATAAALEDLAARFPLPVSGTRIGTKAPGWKADLSDVAAKLRQQALPPPPGPPGADLLFLASEITAAVAYDITHGTLIIGMDQITLVKDVVAALASAALSFGGCRGNVASCTSLALLGLKNRLPVPLPEDAGQRLSRYNKTVVTAWNNRMDAVAAAAGKLGGDKPCGTSDAALFELYEIQNECGKTVLVRVPDPQVLPLLRRCAAVETLQAPTPPPIAVPPAPCPGR
jgi:hypothetical protein